jgi:hypothetical protein
MTTFLVLRRAPGAPYSRSIDLWNSKARVYACATRRVKEKSVAWNDFKLGARCGTPRPTVSTPAMSRPTAPETT